MTQEYVRPATLLSQLLLDGALVKCTCQVRAVDPYDCPVHGHMFSKRKHGAGA